MNIINQYFLKIHFTLVIAMTCLLAFGQNRSNVQVKVYDKALNPQAGIEIKIAGENAFTTNSRGLAFIDLSEDALPPSDIKVFHEKLEVESWNYSKGVLEIILREKSYRQIKVILLDNKVKTGMPGISVDYQTADTSISFQSDQNGLISFTLPKSQSIENPDAFIVKDYTIRDSELNQDGGSLWIEPIAMEVPPSPAPQPDPVVQKKPVIQNEISIENLDSITSITVLYSLMKKLNLQDLDSGSRRRLDKKFNELLTQDANEGISVRNPLILITDSSIVNKDIQQVIEKIRLEELLLMGARSEFEDAAEQINLKLEDGGQHLNEQERDQLVQDVLSLRELLRKNEELFYKNNAFYNEQVNTMLNQLAEIYELEDLLMESEETSTKMRENYIISFFALIGLSIFVVLLIYMIRIFSSQRNDLALANNKIREMNANLELSVSEKTESLKLINHELDTFLYRSSHNLRGPITTIKGLANIASITLGPEATMLFEKVTLTTNGMERMLDKLTMMNHLNSPVGYAEVNINHLVDGIIKNETDLIKRRNIDLNTDVAKDTYFATYPDVVEIILGNLMENALFFSQFTSKGQPVVDLKIEKSNDGSLKIIVRDNGCGIKPEVIDKVWNMFFIGIEKSKGSGLGLFITKKAVDTIKGTITVETEVDNYCEVNVVLPPFRPDQVQNKPIDSASGVAT